MDQTKYSGQKKTFYTKLAIVVLVVLVICGVVFRLLTKNEKSTLTQAVMTPTFVSQHQENAIPTVVFTAAVPSPSPKTVYSAPLASTHDQVMQQLVSQLGLTQSSFSPYVYQSSDKQVSVSQDKDTLVASYTNYSKSPIGSTDVPVLEQAKQFASEFLSKTGFSNPNLVLQEKDIGYVTGTEFTPTSPDKADVIQLPYFYIIDGQPVSFSNMTYTPLVIFVSSKGVFKAEIPQFSFIPKSIGTAQTISQNDLQLKLQTGQYIRLSPIDSSPKSFKVTSIREEYRLDEGQQLLIPFFVLQGTVTLQDDSTTNLDITTAAIPTQSQ